MKSCHSLGLLSVVASLAVLTGCSESKLPGSTAAGDAVEDVQEISLDFAPPAIEGHSHDHEIGPNGGHVVRMQPGDQPVEWVQLDKEETVQIYIPETEKIESVKMSVALEGKSPQDFELQRDEALGAGAFVVKDPILMTCIQMKDLVKVTLHVTADNKTMTVPIEYVGCSCGNH